MVGRLEHYARNERFVNAEIIYVLADLKAVEAAPLIEEAFAADAVDLSMMGDWESVQIELGLLEKRTTPEHNWIREEWEREHGELAFLDDDGDDDDRLELRALRAQQQADQAKRKQARKQAKATKKKQRQPKKKKKRK